MFKLVFEGPELFKLVFGGANLFKLVFEGPTLFELVFEGPNLVSHNALLEWFEKVNFPTKTSTYCFNQ